MKSGLGWMMAVVVIGAAWVRSWEKPVAAPRPRPAATVPVVEIAATDEAKAEPATTDEVAAPMRHRRSGLRLR